MPRLPLLGAAATLAVAAAAVRRRAVPVGMSGERIVLAVLPGGAGFAAAPTHALGRGARAPGRAGVALVIAGAAVCQLPGLAGPPSSSDDAYRYVWDWRVQLAG